MPFIAVRGHPTRPFVGVRHDYKHRWFERTIGACTVSYAARFHATASTVAPAPFLQNNSSLASLLPCKSLKTPELITGPGCPPTGPTKTSTTNLSIIAVKLAPTVVTAAALPSVPFRTLRAPSLLLPLLWRVLVLLVPVLVL